MKRVRITRRRRRDELNAAMWCAADYPATANAVYRAVWWAATGNLPPESDAVRCIAELADYIDDCPAPAMAKANRRAREVMADDSAEVVALDGVVCIVVNGEPVEWSDANTAAQEGKHAHPLGPVIEAWQTARPAVVKPKARTDPIFPIHLVLNEENDARTGRLFSPAHYENTSSQHPQAFLPGLGPGIEAHPPSLPLAFYYAGGKPGEQRGYAAPVALRLWLELVFTADLKRGGRPQTFEIEQKDLFDLLYPNAWRRRNVLPLVQQACNDLDSMRIPIDYDGRGLVAWRVVSVDGKPLERGAPVVAQVKLPPASERGPVIDRIALREYGMKSAIKHRGLLNLAFRLFHPGKTSRPVRGGKFYIPSEDPARYDRLLTADGNPVSVAAAREVVRLFYPGDTANGTVYRQHLHRAIECLRQLEEEGHVRIVDGRIMSPPLKRKPGEV